MEKNQTEQTEWPTIHTGAFRSHSKWPWIHIGADGKIWDARTRRWKNLTTTSDGYQTVWIEGKNHLVHRLVIEAWFGMGAFTGDRPVTRHKIPTKTYNYVWNLLPGSVAENNRDTVRHGHHWQAGKALCPNGHPLKEKNLVAARQKTLQRECRACANARAKVFAEGKKGVDISEQFDAIADSYCDRWMWESYAPENGKVSGVKSLHDSR